MIDEKIIERVRNADVVALLERRGFTFTERSGEFRCKEHPSLAVKADHLSWYWHSKGIGGHGALDFLMKAEDMPFREAVEAVMGIAPQTAPPRRETKQLKTLVLPEKAGVPLHLYDYLCKKRGIDGYIVNTLIQKEMLYEDRRGNVVFVGHDKCGKARFASLRGTHGDCRFRMDCAGSDKRYGFNMAACTPSARLYIFESPIDAMSHASGSIIGECPRCGSPVREGEKGFFCDNRACLFKLWKDNIFFKSKKKTLTKSIVAALMKDGRVFVSGLHSEKSGKKYDATVVMNDTGGKYVNFKLEFEKKGEQHERKTETTAGA